MAPAFRHATLWGVVLGALAAVVVVTFSILWERRSRELKLLRAQVDQLQKELPPALPVPTEPAAGLTGDQHRPARARGSALRLVQI